MVKGQGLKGASRARKIGGRGHKVGRFALNVPEVGPPLDSTRIKGGHAGSPGAQ